jgi:RND family efflux transporter MFP subunit
MGRSGIVRKGVRFILPVLLILVMMLWLTGAFRRGRIEPEKADAPGRPALGVSAWTVVQTRVPILSEAAGTIQPEYRMTISSRVSANVIEMRVRAGQHVRVDDLLARLDDRDLTARMAQAKETLRRAQATRDLAASDYRRDKPLMDKAVIPRSELDQTEMRLRTAEADVQHAREALREAEVSVSYAEIRSPATGVVIDKLADVGDLASPGKPLLTMYLENRLWLEANVREREASLLRIGEEYGIEVEATGERMEGKLVEIVPSADPSSRTVTARVSLPRTEGLFPGMFGRLSIPIRETETLLIPGNAVIRIGQLTMVDVIVEDHLKRRSIQMGEQVGDRVEVLSGLAEGERVALPSSWDHREEGKP